MRRPRYQLTVTDDLKHALGRAATRWPQDADRPGRLLLRLVRAGDAALREDREVTQAQRGRTIEATAGAFTGMWQRGAMVRLHKEWPA